MEDGKAGWSREEKSSVHTALSAAGKPPGHVLPEFTLASELLAEVGQLLPRVAEG